MTRPRSDGGVPCRICGKVRYPQPDKGIYTVAERCKDCWHEELRDRAAAKAAELEKARAERRARQPELPGLAAPPRGVHDGGRR